MSDRMILQGYAQNENTLKVRLRWLGAVLQYPCKFVIVLLSFNILIIIKHH